jgi:hypothetical protein
VVKLAVIGQTIGQMLVLIVKLVVTGVEVGMTTLMFEKGDGIV